MSLAFPIFLLTIGLVIWQPSFKLQPNGLGIGWSATLGALLAFAFGIITPSDIPAVWGIVWNATITFIAIIITSSILDEAGFFEWSALHVARWGKGRGSRLFIFIILLGAATSALFSNDGTALILSPIVISMLAALRFSPPTILAFVMAAGFIADTASLPLVVSNLVNIVSADYFDIGFNQYASVMIPVNIVSILATLGVLLYFYRNDIPNVYQLNSLKSPEQAIRDPRTFRAAWWIILLLLSGFFILEPMGVPVSIIASLAALLLMLIASHSTHISIKRVMRHAPWHIVVFSLGMYLVVYGLRNAGLTSHITEILDYLAQQGIWVSTLGTGYLIAFLSSIMNNMPTVLIGALSIDASHATGPVKEAMIYANVIGSDLGPKITPIGSLATLLWLHILARKNITITWGYYFKVGIILTTPILTLTLLALAIRLTMQA